MGRLTALKGHVASLPARLGYADDVQRDGRRSRDQAQPWRRWYKTAAWQRLRWSVLVRDLFTCKRCGKIEAETAKLVADHIPPHRGDEALFWSEANLQCLCKSCHDSGKQAEEKAGRWARR